MLQIVWANTPIKGTKVTFFLEKICSFARNAVFLFSQKLLVMSKRLAIIEKDSWLEPVEGELNYRHKLYTDKLADIEASSGSIVDFANGYR